MKDYSKVYIDPDEPLSSLLDKIQSDLRKRIVIIIHQNSSIFSGQVNLELIKTYAKRAEKELIFITDIKKIKTLLERVGFRVYADLKDIENKAGDKDLKVDNDFNDTSRTVKEDIKVKHGKGKKFLIALALILVIGLGWFYFAFPVITIKVSPVIKDKTVINQIKVSNTVDKVDYSKAIVPLIKKEIDLNEEIEVETTGEKIVGVTKAKGVLMLINNERQKVTIPQGTMVATRNDIKFKTTSKVVVPQAEIERFMDMVVGVKAGKAEVNIMAINKGRSANVSKGRIVKFINQSYAVKIINPEDSTGGSNKVVKVVTKDDIDRGIEIAKDDLLDQVKNKLKDEFDSTEIFFNNNIKFGYQTLHAQNEIGEVQDSLKVIARIKATGFGVKKEGLKDLVYKLYQESLADEFRLKVPKITIEDLKVTEAKKNQVNISIKTSAKIVGQLEQEKLVERIIGKKVKETHNILNGMAEVGTYQINPANQVNLPQFKLGVRVIITEPVEK